MTFGKFVKGKFIKNKGINLDDPGNLKKQVTNNHIFKVITSYKKARRIVTNQKFFVLGMFIIFTMSLICIFLGK